MGSLATPGFRENPLLQPSDFRVLPQQSWKAPSIPTKKALVLDQMRKLQQMVAAPSGQLN